MEIKNSKSINVAYTLWVFWGVLDKVMECSKISELFQVVYISDAAVHMLLGKAYARELLAHFLVQSSLELTIL